MSSLRYGRFKLTGNRLQSPGDRAASDTPIYRTFSEQFQSNFRAISEQFALVTPTYEIINTNLHNNGIFRGLLNALKLISKSPAIEFNLPAIEPLQTPPFTALFQSNFIK